MRKKSLRRLLSPCSIRLEPAEFDALDAAAALAGVSRARLVREGALALADEVKNRLAQ